MPDYQTVNFHFRVVFELGALKTQHDLAFQSVSGLDATIDTETVKEGGENHFEHVIPLRRKYGPLVLKRGLLKPADSGLTKWFKDAFDNEKISPVTATVSLLNEENNPLMTWRLNNVWPRSWKVGTLDAEQGAVLIETLELNYNKLVFDSP